MLSVVGGNGLQCQIKPLREILSSSSFQNPGLHLEHNIGCLAQLKVAFGDQVIVVGEVDCVTRMTQDLQTVVGSEDL